ARVSRHGVAILNSAAWRNAGAGAWAREDPSPRRRRLRGVDLNHRPRGYEPRELPDCSTPRHTAHPRDGRAPPCIGERPACQVPCASAVECVGCAHKVTGLARRVCAAPSRCGTRRAGPECALERRDTMTPGGSHRLDSTPHGPARARTVLVVDADAQRGATTGIALARHGLRVLLAQSEADVRLRMATTPAQGLVVGPFDVPARQGVIDTAREQDLLVRVVIQLCAGEPAPTPAVVDLLALHGWVDAGSDDGALVATVTAAMSAHERLEHLHPPERMPAELLAHIPPHSHPPPALTIRLLDPPPER